MVRRAWKPSLREASCWRVEVMKGGAGERFFFPFFTGPTTKSAWASSASTRSVSSLEESLISPFSSP